MASAVLTRVERATAVDHPACPSFGTSNCLHYRRTAYIRRTMGLSRKQTQTPNHRPPVPGFDTSPHVAVKEIKRGDYLPTIIVSLDAPRSIYLMRRDRNGEEAVRASSQYGSLPHRLALCIKLRHGTSLWILLQAKLLCIEAYTAGNENKTN